MINPPVEWAAISTGVSAVKSSAMACPPVEIPTTLLWSDADTALGREQAQGSGRYVYGDFRYCELAGVDHWIPQRAAPALASEIALRSTIF